MEGFAPPRRQPPQNGGLPRRKIFFTFFDFCARRFFLLKGKENFSARLRATRGRRGFASARARRNSSPQPPPSAAPSLDDFVCFSILCYTKIVIQ